jgi:Outer membrane protein (OmpH-like).
MKKLFGIVGLMMASVALRADSVVFTIDSNKVLRDSKEGRSIMAQNEKDKRAVIEMENEQLKKITALKEEIEVSMQSGKATEEMMQGKYEELGRCQRTAKQCIDNAHEDFERKSQSRVWNFRNKVHQVAAEFFSTQGCTVVLDTATLIYAAKSSDKTDELKDVLDNRYAQDKATLTLTKSGSKQPKDVKKSA